MHYGSTIVPPTTAFMPPATQAGSTVYKLHLRGVMQSVSLAKAAPHLVYRQQLLQSRDQVTTSHLIADNWDGN
jgi:hypothetical protein